MGFVIDATSRYLDIKSFSIFFILFVLGYLYLKSRNGRKWRRPPGPKGLPLLGYIPFLRNPSYKHFMELRKSYGNVIGLQLGAKYTVVLGDIDAVKDAFSKNDFSARPKDFFKFNDKYENVVNMRGMQWLEHSRFNKTLLRDLGMGKEKIEQVVKEQISVIVSKLDETIAGGQNDINMTPLIALAVDNVIYSMICGKTYAEGDPVADILHEYQVHSLRYFASASLGFSFPMLKPLLLKFHPYLKKTKTSITNLENVLNKEIQEHEESLNSGPLSDFMDYFLNEIHKRNGENGFTKNVLNGTSQFFMLGGSETGRVTLEWALLLLAKHQDVQEKAYREIMDVIGPEKQVSFKDRDSLPYNHAVLLEVQRRKTIVPLSVSRCAQRDTTIAGYDIPKETVVLANIWGIHMDPEVWPEPKKFDPTRFLTASGKRVKVHGCLIPFSYGQRMCPAERLAVMQQFISLTTLIQHFKFSAPSEGLDLRPTISLTYVPVNLEKTVTD